MVVIWLLLGLRIAWFALGVWWLSHLWFAIVGGFGCVW